MGMSYPTLHRLHRYRAVHQTDAGVGGVADEPGKRPRSGRTSGWRRSSDKKLCIFAKKMTDGVNCAKTI